METKIVKIESRPQPLIGYIVGWGGHKIVQPDDGREAYVELLEHDKYKTRLTAPLPLTIRRSDHATIGEVGELAVTHANISTVTYGGETYIAAWQRPFNKIENGVATIAWDQSDCEAFRRVWAKAVVGGREDTSAVISEIGLIDGEGRLVYVITCLMHVGFHDHIEFSINVGEHLPTDV